jgi:type I site-specific restriction-modification system R (restriction) subunit
VNRVYKDKPGGLIVDYLGIASDLKKALSFYSDRSSINGLHPVLNIFSEFSLNIKVDKRWIPFVRNL